jgi:hypothetical protein
MSGYIGGATTCCDHVLRYCHFRYDVPHGYKWASTAEVIAESATCTDVGEAYANKEGWVKCVWEGLERIGFVCW